MKKESEKALNCFIEEIKTSIESSVDRFGVLLLKSDTLEEIKELEDYMETYLDNISENIEYYRKNNLFGIQSIEEGKKELIIHIDSFLSETLTGYKSIIKHTENREIINNETL